MPESILQLFRISSRTALAVIYALILFSNTATAAPDGKALFQSNCASCHNPLKDATGPALKGINATFPSKEWGYNWVHNSAAVIASGDKMAVEMYNKFNKAAMTAFPQLKNEEIDAIFAYVNSVTPSAAPTAGGTGAQSEGSADSNGYLYVIITLSLLVLVVILWKANQALSRAANDKEGIINEKEVPLYRNKVVIAMVAIVAFIMAGYWLVNGAINEGRQQNYRPIQPIFYSHKVHAGINQINCLYCHAGAEKSRQGMIPSSNVCMNCHKQINEYTGEKDMPLKTAEGKVINGTEEIKKLYEYAGWDPVAKKYKLNADGSIAATPIKWVKIHNLPDHVYFNHSQHVKVGQVQCQRCHGEITEMDEVYQFAPLSMGWCINCHRQTQVKFDNDYYSIFAKYREEIKSGKRTGVTVEELGGTECQKCHY
ncbi:c-type cytochrome [Flavipsychrobacter stenotrophus]|uniref:c-type cytochrome n=1 Tax=Flavipsychrobacter stenotrophus TaxID=2077091 RepID=UPI001F0C618B|nr:c-type cytochrome [Flavipsychrobacter stenotrophus]